MDHEIRRLRDARGPQQVTFAEIADHLFDYVERYPEDQEAVDRVALFLQVVEAIPHDHDVDPRRGVPRMAVVALPAQN